MKQFTNKLKIDGEIYSLINLTSLNGQIIAFASDKNGVVQMIPDSILENSSLIEKRKKFKSTNPTMSKRFKKKKKKTHLQDLVNDSDGLFRFV